jgi:hypothetical protein
MTTINSVNTGLSGSTGSGTFVGSTSPTLVTPTLGAATSTSVTFSPTTGGIVGTTTNDNAAAGTVGEYISSTILAGSQVGVANNNATNVTSISLTAGDWEVYGNVISSPAAGTTTTNMVAWISSTSATLPTLPASGAYSQMPGYAASAGQLTALVTGNRRFSLSGTTTIYLSTFITFAVSTMGAYGFIGARRVR